MTDGSKVVIDQQTKDMVCDMHGAYQSNGFTFGRHTHWTNCPTCNQEANDKSAKEEAQRESADRQRRIESRLNKSGIPLRYRTKDFGTYIADSDKKEKALAIAMEFAQNFDAHKKQGTTVVFSGMPGTGKSHLAIAIAQHVMNANTALYTSAIDAVRMIRDTWRKDSPKTEIQVLEELASIDLLIMDEVGVQYGTEAEQVSLFDIIDKRYRDLMPTILLTNLNKGGMKEFLGDRSFDRLREDGIWVTFDWESRRPMVQA